MSATVTHLPVRNPDPAPPPPPGTPVTDELAGRRALREIDAEVAWGLAQLASWRAHQRAGLRAVLEASRPS